LTSLKKRVRKVNPLFLSPQDKSAMVNFNQETRKQKEQIKFI